MISATPVTGQVGKCLHFKIEKSQSNEFIMNFTTTSYRNNQRIWWDVRGIQSGKNLMAKWRLSTSLKQIGKYYLIYFYFLYLKFIYLSIYF